MGILIYRILFCVTLVIFVGFNFVFGVEKTWDFIHHKRWYIFAVLMCFFVFNKFSFSSIGCFDKYVQSGEGSEYIKPIFGHPIEVRSDEWLVDASRLLSAEYVDYGKTNDIVMATPTPNLSASGLYFSWSALAQPKLWGFYLFGSEYGFSFMWSFSMFFGFIISYEFCLLLSRKKRLLSLLGASLIWFSAYNMYWSVVSIMWTGMAAVVFWNYFWSELKSVKRLFYGLIFSVFASNYVVCLYPAWQVPFGYIFLAIAIWVVYENRECIGKYRRMDWIIVAVSCFVLISIIAVYLYNDYDYLIAVMNTKYPGARVGYGGYAINKLFNYYITQFASILSVDGICEKATFYAVFPLGIVLGVFWLIQKRGRHLLLLLLMFPTVLIGTYCLVEIPHFIAKIFLMTFSTPGRAVDSLGFISIVMFLIVVSEIKCGELKLPYVIGLVSLCSLPAIIIAIRVDYSIKRKMLMMFLALGTIILISIIILFSNEMVEEKKVNFKLDKLAYSLLIFGMVTTGILVHPLMKGIDVIKSKPVANFIQDLVEEDKDAKWVAFDSLILSNYLISLGAPTINSVNYIPNFELWKTIDPEGTEEEKYNRYAHIVVNPTENETDIELVQNDYINLSFPIKELDKMGVKYVVSPIEVTIGNRYLKKLYDRSGIYIYEFLDQGESVY